MQNTCICVYTCSHVLWMYTGAHTHTHMCVCVCVCTLVTSNLQNKCVMVWDSVRWKFRVYLCKLRRPEFETKFSWISLNKVLDGTVSPLRKVIVLHYCDVKSVVVDVTFHFE